jgi:hypothetical protein
MSLSLAWLDDYVLTYVSAIAVPRLCQPPGVLVTALNIIESLTSCKGFSDGLMIHGVLHSTEEAYDSLQN